MYFWQEIGHVEEKTVDIKKEILWNNRNIQIKHSTVFYREWLSTGISSVAHLLDEENNFLTFETLKSKYTINTNFVEYHGIISAIPRQWKQMLKEPQIETQKRDKPWHDIPKLLSTKYIYSQVIKHKFVPPSSQSILLNHGVKRENIRNFYLLPFRSTRETKLITFQIKI